MRRVLLWACFYVALVVALGALIYELHKGASHEAEDNKARDFRNSLFHSKD